MPACRYVKEISLAAMLAANRVAGVTPEVNLMGGITCMLPPSVNKDAHSGFETQKRRCHQKSKTGVSVAPQKGIRNGATWVRNLSAHSRISIL